MTLKTLMQIVRRLLRPASSEPSDRGKFAQKRHCNPVTSSDDVPLRMRTVLHTSEASHFFSSALEGERSERAEENRTDLAREKSGKRSLDGFELRAS